MGDENTTQLRMETGEKAVQGTALEGYSLEQFQPGRRDSLRGRGDIPGGSLATLDMQFKKKYNCQQNNQHTKNSII